mgnify:CR=1 FL=1
MRTASPFLIICKDSTILTHPDAINAATIRPDRRFLFASPVHFLALGFGSGLSPKAPGTAGSLAAVPIRIEGDDVLLAEGVDEHAFAARYE